VSNSVLGTLDPTRINNGVYELGLRVVDVNGLNTSVVVPVEVARDRKIGNFRLSFTDIQADASGIPLTLNRTYDSLKKDIQGDFGWGWSADASDISVRKNMVLGENWQLQRSGFNQCLRPVGNRRVTVTLPDGGVYRFQGRNVPECAFAVPPAVNIVYDALPLPVGGSAGAAAGAGTLEVINTESVDFRGGQLFSFDSLGPWNPTDYTFTNAEGARYTLREGVGVLSVADRYGNVVNYGPGGYQHNANVGVTLTRDAQGRITRATDPAGRSLNYAYNSNGELASVSDRLGQVTYFQYDTATRAPGSGDSGSVNSAHLLSSITDPRGVVVMRAQFDDFGRLASTADSNSATATQTFDEVNNLQRTVDRRGNATTYTFDAAGNVARIVDARGGVTELTYDANGNELTRQDPLGNTVTKTYNGVTGKVLTEVDALGRTTSTAYVAGGRDFERQNPASVTDPLGRVTTYGYRSGEATVPGAEPSTITQPLGRITTIGQDAKGNVSSLAIGGIATTYVYDAQGRRTRETDGLGNIVNYTFDANGNELTRSTTRTVAGVPRVETTTRVYDNQNRVVQETDPTGAVRRTTYNAAGQIGTKTDALGRLSRYEYDGNSRLVRSEFPDGSTETASYDANGNKISSTDRQGRVTLMVYDELNRHIETEHPDGSRARMEYDAAGRLTAEVSETGSRRGYSYDVAAQLTSTTDTSGRRTEYTYDAAGNRTQTRLPDGRAIGYVYDALNRLTRTDFPDGSSHAVTYRTDNRKSSETDARGVTTTYDYDAVGRLISAVQSGISAPTVYAYDETNARTQQRDATGREVQWRYDAAGRSTSRVLPDGASETFAYNLEGQLTAHTTFGGHIITRSFDSNGREISRTIPATTNTVARTITWTYNSDGQRATQTETGPTSAQGTTTYTYDARGRLTQLSGPQGVLRWTYDAADRITRRGTSEGNTDYEYDGDGRLTRMVAPDGKPTTYTYDTAGRPLRSEQVLDAVAGIGLVTERRHDAQDRLIAIAHLRRQGGATTLLAGQVITRGTGGAVSRIDTFDGSAAFVMATGSFTGNPSRVQAFGYDANARLTSERSYKGVQLTAFLGDAAASATQATVYTYDNVSNRTAKTTTTSAGTETTAYAFDNNDRLTSETLTTATGTTVTTNYTWDGNGNLASKSAPSEYTGYIFDADKRLVEVRRGATQSTATVVASYGYDGDGQRIRKTTAGGSTRYLIDPKTEWPQVVLESSASQATAYVWGDTLRQQASGANGTAATAPAENLIPLPGHLSTTLAAIDATGAVVEAAEATAYGELANSNPRLKHQYTGEYWQAEAGLTYLRARWMSPEQGRFLSLDPLEGRAAVPKSIARYAYANADPLQYIDPSGEISLASVGGVSINIVSGFATRAQVAFQAGRVVGGQAVRTLGKVVERRVQEMIRQCFKGEIQRNVRVGGGRRSIDFLLELKDRNELLEVKYKVPRSGSEALTRLINQIRSAQGDGHQISVFFSQPFSAAQRRRILDALGPNAPPVNLIGGFVELASYLGEAFIDACI
jgi:RHS repeat-associated protein